MTTFFPIEVPKRALSKFIESADGEWIAPDLPENRTSKGI
jgi:hypothetical protein